MSNILDIFFCCIISQINFNFKNLIFSSWLDSLGKYSLIVYKISFFINLFIFFILIQIITFSFKYFLYSKLFLISLLKFFFIKTSNNLFTITIINNISPWNCFSTTLITKISFDQLGAYPLVKMFLYLEILTWSPTLNLGFFYLILHCIQQNNHL